MILCFFIPAFLRSVSSKRHPLGCQAIAAPYEERYLRKEKNANVCKKIAEKFCGFRKKRYLCSAF